MNEQSSILIGGVLFVSLVAVIEEANAISTAYLRADLLPETLRGRTRELLQNVIINLDRPRRGLMATKRS